MCKSHILNDSQPLIFLIIYAAGSDYEAINETIELNITSDMSVGCVTIGIINDSLEE